MFIVKVDKYKCCGTVYPPKKCLAFGKTCDFGKSKYFKNVCMSESDNPSFKHNL